MVEDMAAIKIKAGVIYDVCKGEGISRAEFARRIGVTEATAWRIDDGRSDPSPKFIAGVMIATGRAFEELFSIVTDAEDAA